MRREVEGRGKSWTDYKREQARETTGKQTENMRKHGVRTKALSEEQYLKESRNSEAILPDVPTKRTVDMERVARELTKDKIPL